MLIIEAEARNLVRNYESLLQRLVAIFDLDVRALNLTTQLGCDIALKGVEDVGITLFEKLNAAVRQIPDVAIHVMLLGKTKGGETEANTLDVSCVENAAS